MRQALIATLAALALGACGGGDDSTTAQKPETDTSPSPSTSTSPTPSAPESNPRAKAITSCLKRAGLFAINNPATQVGGDYELVVNGGAAGVLYGFADSTAAQSGKAKVQTEEGSAGRKTEVIGDTVLAYFAPDQALAEPEKTAKL